MSRPHILGQAQPQYQQLHSLRQQPAAPCGPAANLCGLRKRYSHCFTQSPLPGLAPWRRPEQSLSLHAESGSASLGSGWMDMPESQPPADIPVEVFPRLRERDAFRRLGVEREASFEEIQEARNYLVEQYREHEPSRESIELAFDSILQQTMRSRHKFGFRPPKRGRRGDAEGDAPKLSLWQMFRGKFEPNVPSTTLVNDGSIFLALGLWAAWQAASSDPTLPLGAAICFCAWKLYDKRNKRNPDGPHLGGSPVWGALGSTLLGLVGGAVVSYLAVQVVPLPARVTGEAFGLFLIALSLGFSCIFLK